MAAIMTELGAKLANSKVAVRAGRRKSSILKGRGTNELKDLQSKIQQFGAGEGREGGIDGDGEEGDEHSFSGEEEEDFFRLLRDGNLQKLEEMVSQHPSLVDVEFGVVDGGGGSAYAYSGKVDDGFCGPFHIAAEAGRKDVLLFLQEKHPEEDAFLIEDYKERLPEEVANGEAVGLLKQLREKVEAAEGGGFSAQDEEDFFYALRAGVMETVETLVGKFPGLLEAKFGVWEGYDTKGMMPQVKSKRIYTYTGNLNEGFCGPYHVAAEAGHKGLILFLSEKHVREGGYEDKDYRGKSPEEIANGEALDAFKELRGMSKEAKEVFEGEYDAEGERKVGRLLKKLEGYEEDLIVHYNGHWKEGKFWGNGVLYWEGIVDRDNEGRPLRMYEGGFRAGKFHGRGVLFADPRVEKEGLRFGKRNLEEKVFVGNFKDGLKHGQAVEWQDNEIIFEGNYKNGKKSGYGVYTPAKGNRYEGNFEDDKKHGAGTYFFPDGSKYEGMFHEDIMHGHATVYKSGQKPKNFIYEDGKEVEEVSKKFIADPLELFGEGGGGGGGGIEGRAEGVEENLFDRDDGLDAYIVRIAIVFLDGLGKVLERKRMKSGGDEGGDWVFEQLQTIVTEAKGEVIARRKEMDTYMNRKGMFATGDEEEMLEALNNQEGDISNRLIEMCVNFANNDSTGRGESIVNRLEILLLRAKANFK
ncbi:hypothetical protein TrCOL_g12084 [Triparma columacea]|uniref:Uncharacterized protein n=1 Tax=Triparma columacea TaxID=722753 RepID=A0A9W7GNG8_9STRA|nr:hypothetical protein TrCOL_g12084 [Triparma columacea]